MRRSDNSVRMSHCPANARRWPGAVLMLGRRRRRRSSIKTTLGQRPVLLGVRAFHLMIRILTGPGILRREWGSRGSREGMRQQGGPRITNRDPHPIRSLSAAHDPSGVCRLQVRLGPTLVQKWVNSYYSSFYFARINTLCATGILVYLNEGFEPLSCQTLIYLFMNR